MASNCERMKSMNPFGPLDPSRNKAKNSPQHSIHLIRIIYIQSIMPLTNTGTF